MKPSKLKKIIQKPLRFHHQDIHEELDDIRNELKHINDTLQVLREGVEELVKEKQLRMPKSGNDLW
jgi:uncharacterized coiled-coil DUF342 family protein